MPVLLTHHVIVRPPLFAALLALLLAGSVLLPPPAAAQDNQALIDRVNRLQADLQALQRQVYRGGSTPPAALPSDGSLGQTGASGQSVANQLAGRIDDLESQVRALTGRFEEVEFKASQVQQNLDKLSKDIDFRLTQLERGQQPGVQPAAEGPAAAAPANAAGQPLARGSTSATPGAAPTKEGVLGSLPVDASGRPLPGAAAAGTQTAQRAAPPAAAAPSARAKLPPGSPQEQYNYAYKLLVQSDYADAEGAFREFLGAHPQDPLAGNAQYWLGETFYVRQQYEQASAAFLTGYQNYPKGAKASDSLLKLGMSLAALKKNPEACAALGQLSKQFPEAPPHVKDAAQRERAKVGCK
ncbi:tol-pal system protein YbgF [Ferrovibrio xuzhouensis]|uniref:Cell division coordinator CpoB n=1 Tax=Ferrovibrio xuzhouensis TaxID=1576914 RepID=A0ABV7VCL9_9PROT